MEEIGRATVDGFFATFPGPGTTVSGDVTLQADHMHSCAGGGAIDMDDFMRGTVNQETQSGPFELQLNLIFSACRVTGDGKEFTISATPRLGLEGNVGYRDGLPDGSQTFALSGGFWWVDGRSAPVCAPPSFSWSGRT